MCIQAEDALKSEPIRNIGDMRKIAQKIFWRNGDGWPPEQSIADDCCLCVVDVPVTLMAAGFKVWSILTACRNTCSSRSRVRAD